MYYVELFIAGCIFCIHVQMEISNDVILCVGTETVKKQQRK